MLKSPAKSINATNEALGKTQLKVSLQRMKTAENEAHGKAQLEVSLQIMKTVPKVSENYHYIN